MSKNVILKDKQGNQLCPATTAEQVTFNSTMNVKQAIGTMQGSPLVAETADEMTDTSRVYVYVGSEAGYTFGNWYYYDGADWVSGGVYNAVAVVTDTTLTESGVPADAKATGDAISEISDGLDDLYDAVNGIISRNFTENKNLYGTSVTHSVIDDPTSCVSEMIPLTWTWDANTYNRFYFNNSEDDPNYKYNIFFFDSNHDFLGYKGSYGDENRRVIGFNGSAYVQFSFRKGTVGKITNDAKTTTYWTATETVTQKGIIQNIGDLSNLNTTSKDSIVNAVNEVFGDIPDLPITPKDTSFFHMSKNMIDPSLCVSGEYVNQGNGTFASNASHNRTGFIEIEPSTTYVVRRDVGAFGNNFRYVFYTSAKAYISGAYGALESMLLTSPATAKYLVISDTTEMAQNMIALYTGSDKSFEYFDNTYVLNQYIKEDLSDLILNVPSKVYALVGFETNIYFENITEKWENFHWDVTCSKGMQLERGYRITPVAGDEGTYTLTIRAYTSEESYKEVTTDLIVTSASAGSGETVSVIILGDSTTYNGIAVEKLHDNFDGDVMSVQTLGTMGTAPNNHEGRSGWSWFDYFTKASITYPSPDPRGTIYNAFYNPTTQTFDADYYFTNSGISEPDFFFVNLGINDVFGYTSDSTLESGMTTIMQRCEDAVQSILDATTDTKVCVCLTIPPNHSQDAFGKAYACSQTRDRCKRNNTIWVDALIEQFKGRESDRIYIIPINACLDTVYNMGMESDAVNSRNSTTYQSPNANGGVHPVESGYWQIADVYTAFLKANVPS